jgi:hypothetical protein
MLTPDDMEQTTGAIERPSRTISHRDVLNERRQNKLQQRQTDLLPALNGDAANGKLAMRQVVQLREENRRLRAELAEYERDIEAIHNSHKQETEQYQSHMLEVMEQRNRVQEAHLQLERRYQELYHSFQTAVEEEAQNMVTKATQTLDLHPDERPDTRNDIMKTVELHIKEVEEYHTAEAVYLMQQAQRKALQMEHELARERLKIKTDRENLQAQQTAIREQAKVQQLVLENRLRHQWTLALASMATLLLLILPLLQVVFFSLVRVQLTAPMWFALIVPVAICVLLAVLFARVRANASIEAAKVANKKKAVEQQKATGEKKDAKPASTKK